MQIDTSSVESIRQFALQYRKQYSKLDVLINNAGINRGEQAVKFVNIENEEKLWCICEKLAERNHMTHD